MSASSATASTVEIAAAAAQRSAINVLAQAQAAIGDLDRIVQVVRLGGFFAVDGRFDPLPQAMNGASDLMAAAFGERGRHARTTVGVAFLPLGAIVEVEALVRDRAVSAPDWLVARPIAHRGLHDPAKAIAENSIGAADAAIAGGFAIECDVQLSRDGEAMVFHDDALRRLARARGALSARSVAELQAIPLRVGGERMPTLPQLLARIALAHAADLRTEERLRRRHAAGRAGRRDRPANTPGRWRSRASTRR